MLKSALGSEVTAVGTRALLPGGPRSVSTSRDHAADGVSLSPPLCPDVSTGSSVPAVALDRGPALSPSVRALGSQQSAGRGGWCRTRGLGRGPLRRPLPVWRTRPGGRPPPDAEHRAPRNPPSVSVADSRTFCRFGPSALTALRIAVMSFSKPRSRSLRCGEKAFPATRRRNGTPRGLRAGRGQRSGPLPGPSRFRASRRGSPVGFVQNQPLDPAEVNVLCGFYVIHQPPRS